MDGTTWSIAEVAKASGVTARTLRHYHAIGLLEPVRTAPDGRRYYGDAELLRLQQILLLRDLGLGLDAVGEVLAHRTTGDTIEALGRHKEWLLREQLRLGRLVRTVEATIENIRNGGTMAPDKVFEGFEHNPYEAEARERWGDEVVDEGYRKMRSWTPAEAEQAKNGYVRVHEQLAVLKSDGAQVGEQRVQDVVREHFAVTSLFWSPTAEAYRGLGQMYVDDERFRRNIGSGDDSLVEYLRDAMEVYAAANL
ncbi:TipAS antibiotic-recognition domain-containing protein [Kribbella sp. NPDC051770]|uniref:MerR family transcriptional regulator n=1 Tax=Kribbella sp. NPDC051770 TaxID=3155413 RepID=UPI00342B6D98